MSAARINKNHGNPECHVRSRPHRQFLLSAETDAYLYQTMPSLSTRHLFPSSMLIIGARPDLQYAKHRCLSSFATANGPENPSHESGSLGHIFLAGLSAKANPDDHLPNSYLVDLRGFINLVRTAKMLLLHPVRHTMAGTACLCRSFVSMDPGTS